LGKKFICSEHFEQQKYINPLKRKYLVFDAIPTKKKSSIPTTTISIASPQTNSQYVESNSQYVESNSQYVESNSQYVESNNNDFETNSYEMSIEGIVIQTMFYCELNRIRLFVYLTIRDKK